MVSTELSVFIVNYNTRDLLKGCLRSIFDYRGDLAISVYIADNHSDDGSVEMVEEGFPEVYVVRHQENLGFTKAINGLLSMGKGEYFLILHPDMELNAATLRNLVDFFKAHPKAGIVGGNLYYPDDTPNPCEVLWPGFRNEVLCFAFRLFRKLGDGLGLPTTHNPIEWNHKATARVNWVWNACMMVRKEVFDQIGLFDESFFVWFADWDFCRRATNAGWSVYYLYSAKAVHHERQSFAKEGMIKEEILYKIDGWHSTSWQIQDRFTFLKKHASPLSILGVKMVSIVENIVRLWLILRNFLLRRVVFDEASFQLRACFQAIQSILKA